MSQSQNSDGLESTPKMPRRDDDNDDNPLHHPLPHLLNPLALASKTPTSVPLLFLNQEQQHQLQKRQEEKRKDLEQQKKAQEEKMGAVVAAAVAANMGGSTSSMPPSPVQPVLTPIPPEISVNAQMELRKYQLLLIIFLLYNLLNNMKVAFY